MNQYKALGLCGLLLRWCTVLRYHIAATFTLYESVFSSIEVFWLIYNRTFLASFLRLPPLPPTLYSSTWPISDAKLLSGHHLRHFPDRENEKGTPRRESLVGNEHGQARVSWMSIKKQRKDMFISIVWNTPWNRNCIFQALFFRYWQSPGGQALWKSGNLVNCPNITWNTGTLTIFQSHRCLY